MVTAGRLFDVVKAPYRAFKRLFTIAGVAVSGKQKSRSPDDAHTVASPALTDKPASTNKRNSMGISLR
ncbi:hypothetical protein [Candidatus Amarobacter glycogenicus]|uniref:hypothetical protein n=1 Tax=Candidatus Amarobacter glycogenicus TaxID=3140699 RepID=UPI0031372132|nr:hypothetical protein [Dehalococcoidia bacterium]